MNCTRCQYLLWDLTECRCPECAAPFEVSDFAFTREHVHFLCPDCGQAYLGSDEQGLPTPSRFECVSCSGMIDVATMRVHPVHEEARGMAVRSGTAWEHRDYFGRVPAFLDGIANIATRPGEYYRRVSHSAPSGALIFSVLSGYLAAAVFLGMFSFLVRSGILAAGINDRFLAQPKFWLYLGIGVPFGQIVWNYVYGFIIYAVLRLMDPSRRDYEATVRAVAYGSAVLPAMCILPPVGLLWYTRVVACGVESFHQTSRSRAFLATVLPLLLVAHLVAGLVYTALMA